MSRYRKIIISLLLASACMGFLSAAPGEPAAYTKGIKIQGGYDSVAAINVTPLATQSEGYLLGMPFPLNDSSVMVNASEKGRLIAKWNVLSNRRFLLDITAEIMHPESEDNTKEASYVNGLGYILKFVYNLSYYSGQEVNFIENGMLELKVADSTVKKVQEFKDMDILKELALDTDSLVGSAEGSVYFKFDNSTTSLLTDEALYSSLPDGNYLARVVITLKVPV